MTIKCPHCGYDANRDEALFCRQCGKRLSSGPPVPKPKPRQPSLLPQQQAGPPQPTKPSLPWIRLPSTLTLTPSTSPVVTGRVTACNERRDQPPTDWYRLLFIGSLLLMFSPAIMMGIALLCLVPAIAIAISILLGLFRRPSGPAEIAIYELSVEDVHTGRILNVEMIGQRGGGTVAVGDEVNVYGQWTDPTVQDSVRAWEIHVTHRYSPSQAKVVPCGAIIRARRPFPPAVAVSTFAITLVAILWACGSLSTR